jgi:hypothetical protein
MAKASLTLANGTVITLEGTPEEVHRLLQLYSEGRAETSPKAGATSPKAGARSKRATSPRPTAAATKTSAPDLTAIVNLVKECKEADEIETNILNRASVVDRVLLPLYVVKNHMKSSEGLTSGEIARITRELGVPISQPNVSTALSGTASKYVMGDKVRRKGHTVRYRVSRRGEQYLSGVIGGEASEE